MNGLQVCDWARKGNRVFLEIKEFNYRWIELDLDEVLREFKNMEHFDLNTRIDEDDYEDGISLVITV